MGRPRVSSWKRSDERYSSAIWSGRSSYILISSTITSRSRSRSASVGLKDHVAHDVQGPLQMLRQKAGVEHRVLFAGCGVLLGADALEGFGYAQGVHVRSALEEHVLHQVGDAGDLVFSSRLPARIQTPRETLVASANGSEKTRSPLGNSFSRTFGSAKLLLLYLLQRDAVLLVDVEHPNLDRVALAHHVLDPLDPLLAGREARDVQQGRPGPA